MSEELRTLAERLVGHPLFRSAPEMGLPVVFHDDPPDGRPHSHRQLPDGRLGPPWFGEGMPPSMGPMSRWA